MKTFIPLKDAAERLNLHPDTLRYWAQQKERLNCKWDGGLLLVSEEDVRAYAPHVLRHGSKAFRRVKITTNLLDQDINS